MPLLGMGHTSQPLTQPSRLSTTGGAKVENEDTIGGQLWGPEWGGCSGTSFQEGFLEVAALMEKAGLKPTSSEL